MKKPETKQAIHKMIFERAYEIETQLSEDNFFLAGLVGLKPEQVEETALIIAIKELKKTIAE
jgi:hypothetical protein